MSREKITIKTADDHIIYGELHTGAEKQPKLVIFLHGLTHSHHHYLPLLAGEFFPAHGFDFFAFSFYWREPKGRSLPDVTLSTQIADLEAVLTHFRGLYEEIYLIGHSLGGLTALIANPADIKAQSLWDPSFDVTHFWELTKCLTPMPERAQYQLDYGNVYVLGKAMIDEIARYPDTACLKLAESVQTPTQLVIPSESIFLASPETSPESYLPRIPAPAAIEHMEKANHTFAYDGNAEKLFILTLKWFNAAHSQE